MAWTRDRSATVPGLTDDPRAVPEPLAHAVCGAAAVILTGGHPRFVRFVVTGLVVAGFAATARPRGA